MGSTPLQTPDITDLDPRWQLVERIVASDSFARSARLSSFLSCVCALAREGRLDEINEQYIGTAVFDRKPGYDPGVDSIVRSHASRLRHRLAQYFEEEGRHEQWLLTIPKGSYQPVFRLRFATESPAPPLLGLVPEPPSPATLELPAAPRPTSLTVSAGPQRLVRILAWAVAFMTLLSLCLAAWLLRERHDTRAAASAGMTPSKRLFWSRLFNSQDQTVVVTADSGLVMLQGATKKRVTLPMYVNGTYLNTIDPSMQNAGEVRDLGIRRYTSTVDLMIMDRILRMTAVDVHNTRFIYARDLTPSEIKQGNAVLLGTYESTPWVQLFEPGMNFYFRNDLAGGVFSAINRHPLPGEQASYDSLRNDPAKTVYGVVAYRPSLDGAGRALILEGQSMAGTESASDFVFDDGHFLPFLQSIERPDGTIPFFELLVRSTSLRGQSARLEIVARRIEDR